MVINTSQVRKIWNSKPADVEDLLDLYLHRPFAYLLLVALLTLPKKLQPTPNVITLGSLLLGWLGATIALEGMIGQLFPFHVSGMIGLGGSSFWQIHLASWLMFMSMVFDCADGQLARATGTGSQWGRFIDGVADILVVISYCVFISLVLLKQYGIFGFVLGAVSSIGLQQHLNFYDKTKTAYSIICKDKDHAELTATIDRTKLREDLARAVVDPKVTMMDQFLINFAIWYAEGLNLDAEFKILNKDPTQVDAIVRRSTMRACSFCGGGVQLFIVYMSVLATAYIPGALLMYCIVQSFGGNYYRYVCWKNTLRDRILAQKEFFQIKMTIPVLGIGVAVYFLVGPYLAQMPIM